MIDLLTHLNPSQAEAVLHTEGPLLIFAGAGSGKTRVITYRIAHLIQSLHVPPRQILAVTFTNKAAREMRERVDRLVAPQSHGIYLATFHSACMRMLRKSIHHLGLKNDFTIYDISDQVAVLKSCAEGLSLNEERYPPKMLLGRISKLKQELISPDHYAERAPTFGFEEKLAKIYTRYQARLREFQALDFDDLIGETIRLLETMPEVRQHYQEQFRYILIDEYQDTNHAQYRLISLLLSSEKNLCVVGDDDQSIYAFRGANVENILQFERDFPSAKVIVLNQNYRSTRTILSAASAVVEKNRKRREKSLWTENKPGEPIVWAEVADEAQEAAFVRSSIQQMRKTEGRPFSDFCVLYRTNAQSRVLEEALRQGSLPYVIFGGQRFYERKEIKDLIAYLRLILYPNDLLSFRRVINLPPRGLGMVSIERLSNYAESAGLSLYDALGRIEESDLTPAAKKGFSAFHALIEGMREAAGACPLHQLIRLIMEEVDYMTFLTREYGREAETRIENVHEFIAAAEQYDPAGMEEIVELGEEMRPAPNSREWNYWVVKSFLDQIALVTYDDGVGQNSVTLMTLHSAKGLEFPVVFMVGMEMGIFPHARSFSDFKEMEEERRLCYVGITRAKERLFVTSAVTRRLFGTMSQNKPSPFVLELPPALIHRVYPNGRMSERFEAAPPRVARDNIAAGSLPSEGSAGSEGGPVVGGQVRHPLFGMGQVERYEGQGDEAKVTVSFHSVGTKKLSVKYAKLTPC